MYRNLLFGVLFLCAINGVYSQTNPSSNVTDSDEDDVTQIYEKYDSRFPHCFRFTWLGPTYDNTTTVNGTCKGLKKKYNLKNTPCEQPLVITYDGTPPDIDFIWENYRDVSVCRKAKGQSCVKYSYYFNNQLQNVTYMCAKALAVDEGAVTSGCYSMVENGYETQACICQSNPGNFKPCNSAIAYQMPVIVLMLAAILNLCLQ